jgi:Spy/CpxP family protein refolding chaperone
MEESMFTLKQAARRTALALSALALVVTLSADEKDVPAGWPPPPAGWGMPPAGMGGFPMGPRMGGMVGPERDLDSLDLSDAQKARLKDLRRARRDRIQKMENTLDDAREDFGDLLLGSGQGPEFEKKARAKHAEVAAAQQALETELFESILEIRGLLTPAQLKKFNKIHRSLAARGPFGPGGFGLGKWPATPQRSLSGTAGD